MLYDLTLMKRSMFEFVIYIHITIALNRFFTGIILHSTKFIKQLLLLSHTKAAKDC